MPESTAGLAMATRPLALGDAQSVYELTYAAEEADTGHPMVELEDIRGDWARPSYQLGEQSIGCFEDEALVAYGEVHKNRLEAYVHPAHRGRGIGTLVYTWALSKARERGYDRLGQTVPVANRAAIALFEAHGATRLYSSWILELPEGAAIDEQALPPGHRLRTFEPDRDTYAVYRIIEDAFNEWPDRQPSSFGDWQAIAFGRADFAPWQVITVVQEVDGVEQLVGACRISVTGTEGWLDQIAVRRDARGRGLARVMLAAAFAEARRRGARCSRLNTDSRTGALGLYEHVGMRVAETYEHYAVALHPVASD